jgi:hypothetical protein
MQPPKWMSHTAGKKNPCVSHLLLQFGTIK